MKHGSEFGHPKRVLVVEDDEVDAEAVRRAVAARGLSYEISVATDGNQALQTLHDPEQDWKPGEFFILLDLNMPGMNGHQFLASLRADSQFRQSIVFVLTTSSHVRDIKLAYDHHICGYFLKSDFNTALDAIAQYVAAIRFPPNGTGAGAD